MNTAQKAPITVTDANDTNINEALVNGEVTSSDTEILTIEHGNFGAIFAIAQGAGTATIDVTHDGQDGSLDVTVDAGTLTITLGTPVPK